MIGSDNIWTCDLCRQLSAQKGTNYTNTKLGIVEPDKGVIHTSTDSGVSMQLRIKKDNDGNIEAAQLIATQRCRKCKSEQHCVIQATSIKILRL